MNKISFERLLPDKITDLEEYLETWAQLRNMKRGSVHPFTSPPKVNPKLVWKFELYIQASLYRVDDLLKLIEMAWETETSLGCYIAARNLAENVAQLFDIQRQSEAMINARNFDGLCDLIDNRLFQSKLKKYLTPAGSIMAAVDKVDKTFKGFREQYDLLSEVVHPNYIGMLGHYGELIESKHQFNFSHSESMSRDSLGRIFGSVFISTFIYTQYVKIMNDLLPRISKLCPDHEE